ncbi:hypothetical protein [Streptomyces sp. NRRL S-87]|uniref:hypothetical protein n=1 Tax=Streptomyces sp. NRRL S-87 TaxID=1463920 RepID=UPI000A736C2D|nr:hypothetical protein [Streptomyces sp. NRRL S-87]
MDSTELVAAAVRTMTELGSGAAGAAATGAGQALSDLVRQRLTAGATGRAALAAVDERPGDEAAAEGLRDELASLVAADGAFAAELARALAPLLAGPPPPAPPAPHGPGSIVIDGGSRVRGSTIALGPVTFADTPSGRAALVAVCAGLAVLVVILVYGGAQLLGDDPGRPGAAPGWHGNGPAPGSDGSGREGTSEGGTGGGSGTAGGTTARAAALADAEAARAVLPDAASLPAGWVEQSAPTAAPSSQDDGSSYEARSLYLGRYSMETEFRVFAYPDEATARAAYAKKAGAAREQGAHALTIGQIGDERLAVVLSTSQGAAYVTHTSRITMVRTGTVLTLVVGKDNESRSYSAEDLSSLTQLLAERARAAQAG